MQVEAVHQLAIALSTSPKLLACVLGSGISRSAGIATGWEIVLDLVRKHAAQLGKFEAANADPALWYAREYGREPDYSGIVQRLAPTTDLRRSLLEPYFTVADPVTQERREHAPTPAHRAIASLVRRGLVRVIVTTNFDRLMESALREAGVARVEVVSSEEEAANCYPFHAAEAFVFKVHGDWRDTRLRNARAELEQYPTAIAELLVRIVGEHGLIVCGWSAEYDLALRQAIQQHQRRFPVYWADPGKLGDAAERLCEQLHATRIQARADELFDELQLASAEWERSRPPPALSDEVLVARAKRLIAEKREMELEDLVQDATRGLCAWIADEFDASYDAKAPIAQLRNRARELLQTCEQHSKPLARLFATLGRYRQSYEPVQRALSTLLRTAHREAASLDSAETKWSWLCAYPALLCAYAYGVAAGYRDDWRSAILAARDAGSGERGSELRLPPGPQVVFASPAFGRDGALDSEVVLRFVNAIADWCFELVSDWLARREDFDRTFDRVDLLLCVLSLRPGLPEWKPRCSMPRDANDGARTTFDETVEDWLIHNVERSASNSLDDPLEQVFHGVDDDNVYERIRAWNPAPSR